MPPSRPFSAAFALFLAAHVALPASAQDTTVFAPRPTTPEVVAPNTAAPRAGALFPRRAAAPTTTVSSGPAPAIHSNTSTLAMLGLGVAGLALLAGLGGGDEDSTDGPDEVTPPQPPAAPKPPTPISVVEGEQEYQINPALRSARASTKYAQGLTGNGVRIGVLDSGIQDSKHLQGAIDRRAGYSTFGDDYRTSDDSQTMRHGTAVAQIIAGRRDGDGTYGLAYDATLVDLVVSFEDTDTIEAEKRPTISSITPAIQAGIKSGTRLFNASLGYPESAYPDTIGLVKDPRTHLRVLRKTGFYEGMIELAKNDGLIVIATGNDGTLRPNMLASVGLQPEMNGHVIAATAIDATDTITGFATRCGLLQDYCIAAVGENVPVFRKNGEIYNFRGTSASAPVVTGAVALIHQEFPEISLMDAGKIVLETARDLGAPGTDEIYGRGALDLGNALTPQGEIRIAAATDVRGLSYSATHSVVRAEGPLAYALPASLQGHAVGVYDAYTRGYLADLDTFVSATGDDSPLPAIDATIHTPTLSTRSFGTDGALVSLRTPQGTVGLGYGRADLFGAASRGLPIRTGYSPLGALEEAASVSYQAHATAPTYGAQVDPGQGWALWAMGDLLPSTRGGMGVVHEREQVLGSSFSGAMGQDGSATTVFADLATDADLGRGWSLGAYGTLAHTRFEQDGIFQSGRLTSASAEVALTRTTADGHAWTGFVGTPLTIHSGDLTLDLPASRLPSTGTTTSTGVLRASARADIATQKAPLDLGVRYQHALSNGHLGATAGVRIQDSESKPFLGVGLALRF